LCINLNEYSGHDLLRLTEEELLEKVLRRLSGQITLRLKRSERTVETNIAE